VHVLDPDPAAVRVPQHAKDVPQPHPLLSGEAADMSIKKGAVVWISSSPDGNALHKAVTPGDL